MAISEVTVEPFIFILNLTLMIDEHGGQNADEMEDLDEG